MMTFEKEQITAIKIVLGSLQYQGIPINKTVEEAVKYFRMYYRNFADQRYVKLALIHIRAYLEMGFVYDEFKELFDEMLKELGESRQSLFSNLNRGAKAGKAPGKSEVRSMIRRWSSSRYHTTTIDEVISDILGKVEEKQKGIYYYHSNANPQNQHLDDVYELVVSEYETYLHDISRNKYFKLD